MIRPLRHRHRVVFVLLTVALITLFIAGLLARPDQPPPNHLRLPLQGNAR